ncbi:hypothetical protein PROFUN_12776 [Planoprotostelium fungivorum]|uniref:BRCT domain-containing protein n=1 Tax=Planoprotostelium fungivorum TaxID=1890364 RepID=A0A2P6N6H9_9EUKA|nr:hypothetical protein PROFUN_12776 [Planoprotostelium fungivorum]
MVVALVVSSDYDPALPLLYIFPLLLKGPKYLWEAGDFLRKRDVSGFQRRLRGGKWKLNTRNLRDGSIFRTYCLSFERNGASVTVTHYYFRRIAHRKDNLECGNEIPLGSTAVRSPSRNRTITRSGKERLSEMPAHSDEKPGDLRGPSDSGERGDQSRSYKQRTDARIWWEQRCADVEKQQKIQTISNIFEGLNIYLQGYSSEASSLQLKELINLHSGRVSAFFSSKKQITHIVCRNLSGGAHDRISQSPGRLFIVDARWVLDSCKAGKRMEENNYTVIKRQRTSISDFFGKKKDAPEENPTTTCGEEEITCVQLLKQCRERQNEIIQRGEEEKEDKKRKSGSVDRREAKKLKKLITSLPLGQQRKES